MLCLSFTLMLLCLLSIFIEQFWVILFIFVGFLFDFFLQLNSMFCFLQVTYHMEKYRAPLHIFKTHNPTLDYFWAFLIVFTVAPWSRLYNNRPLQIYLLTKLPMLPIKGLHFLIFLQNNPHWKKGHSKIQ